MKRFVPLLIGALWLPQSAVAQRLQDGAHAPVVGVEERLDQVASTLAAMPWVAAAQAPNLTATRVIAGGSVQDIIRAQGQWLATRLALPLSPLPLQDDLEQAWADLVAALELEPGPAPIVDAALAVELAQTMSAYTQLYRAFAAEDWPRVLAAREALAIEAIELKAAWGYCPIAEGRGVFRHSGVRIDWSCADNDDRDLEHRTYAFHIDMGGNDIYTGGAGGSTEAGRVFVAGKRAGCVRVQQCVGFLLDAGGDDQYLAAEHYDPRDDAGIIVSGGLNGGGFGGVGMLIDLSGTDRYVGSRGSNGGGHGGAKAGRLSGLGLLIDVCDEREGGCDDVYEVIQHGANGGGFNGGAGPLVDTGGDDQYLVSGLFEGGVNGGGQAGLGFLVDVAGNDTYLAYDDGVNGGAYTAGAGFLYDGSGKDSYSGTRYGVNGGARTGDANAGQEQTVFGAANLVLPTAYDLVAAINHEAAERIANAMPGGRRVPPPTVGFLFDGSDHGAILPEDEVEDSFSGHRYGVNGGASTGLSTGLLIDMAGRSHYLAESGGTNGGGMELAAGALFDFGLEGDEYDATRPFTVFTSGNSDSGHNGSNGGGYNFAVGYLYDAFGDDLYAGESRGANGGAYLFGVGHLIDQAGCDTYSAGSEGANGGALVHAAGHLLDLGPCADTETFTAGEGGTNGGASRTAAGLLLNEEGSSTYTACYYGTNGGAHAGGFGNLIDAGGNDTYRVAATGACCADTASDGGHGGNGGNIPNLYEFATSCWKEKGFVPYCRRNGTTAENQIECAPSETGGGSGLLLDAAGHDSYPEGDDNSDLRKGRSGRCFQGPLCELVLNPLVTGYEKRVANPLGLPPWDALDLGSGAQLDLPMVPGL